MAESLSDLPPNILSDILARLPIKSICTCRSVCKPCLDVTYSNPYFNSLHSSNATQNLVIQYGDLYTPTRLVNLIDLDFDFASEISRRPMFQIPLYPEKFIEKYRISVGRENKFVLVNSCNGLLYFAEKSVLERSFVCNPITNEYVRCPEFDEKKNERQLTMGSWLGFNPRENEYKVLRIFSTLSVKSWETGLKEEFWTQVHTVGSDSWRDIEDKPLSEYISWDTCSVFLNGTLFWFCRYPEISKFIVFFDFEKEKFGEIWPPADFGIDELANRENMSIGVFEGQICLINDDEHFDLWVMKRLGIQDSWTNELTVDKTINPHVVTPFDDGSFQLERLQILSNGKILMIWADHVIVCYDPKRKSFEILGFTEDHKSLGKAVLFTPSFVPLKDTLSLMLDSVQVRKLT